MSGFGWSSWLVEEGFLVEAKLGNLLYLVSRNVQIVSTYHVHTWQLSEAPLGFTLAGAAVCSHQSCGGQTLNVTRCRHLLHQTCTSFIPVRKSESMRLPFLPLYNQDV